MSNACEVPFAASANQALCELFKTIQTIAIVGLSPKEHRDSHIVAKYLQEKGFKVIPVYPREEEILGEKVYRSLSGIPLNIDCVVVFRKSEDTPLIALETVKLEGIKSLWLQKGVSHPEAQKTAEKSDITYVEDKCIMVEHKRC